MRRIALLFALVLVVAACGDDDTATTTQATTAPTTAASDSTSDMTDDDTADDEMSDDMDDGMDEDMSDDEMSDDMDDGMGDMSMEGAIFEITMVTFDSPMVLITNVGTESASLGGYWLCQRPSYQELPEVEVGAGESVAISLGGDSFDPPADALTIDGSLNLGSIAAGDGEIGLYTSNSFSSADAIVSYVEWGSSGHGRSATAIEAGQWDEGGFVATTDSTTGIQQDTFFSMSSTGWSDF